MSEIIFYDYQKLKYFKIEENKIVECNILDVSKKKKNRFYVSILNSSDVINATVEIPKTDTPDGVSELVEFTAYQDLGLDESQHFKINYFPKNNQKPETGGDFDIFAVNAELISKNFEPVIETIKYIDYVAIPAFLFKSLYNQKILDSNKTDCFLYFGLNDSFIAVYHKGKCIFFKALKFSIKELSEKFNGYYGKILDFENFISILSTNKLKQKDHKFIMALDNLYNDIITQLMDILMYIKRLNSIEDFEMFFIDSDYGLEKDFYEMFRTTTEFDVKKFDFDFPFKPHNNRLLNLIFLSAIDYMQKADESINFTIYEKPLPLIKRGSFHFLLLSAASIAIMVAYPIYNYSLDAMMYLENQQLLESSKQIGKRIDSFSKTIADYTAKIESSENEIANVNQQVLKLESAINSILSQKKSRPKKLAILVNTIKQINSHKLAIKKCKIETIGDSTKVKLVIVSKNEHYITNFVETLSKDFTIAFEEISKIDKTYTSDIEVFVR